MYLFGHFPGMYSHRKSPYDASMYVCVTLQEEMKIIRQESLMLLMRHQNVSNGLFSPNVLVSGVENMANPAANTYRSVKVYSL